MQGEAGPCLHKDCSACASLPHSAWSRRRRSLVGMNLHELAWAGVDWLGNACHAPCFVWCGVAGLGLPWLVLGWRVLAWRGGGWGGVGGGGGCAVSGKAFGGHVVVVISCPSCFAWCSLPCPPAVLAHVHPLGYPATAGHPSWTFIAAFPYPFVTPTGMSLAILPHRCWPFWTRQAQTA